MERGRLRLKIGDVLVVLITLLLAAGAFAVFHWTRADTQTPALILSDGETVARVALPAVRTTDVEVPGKDICIRIEGDRVWVLHSDCPDQICVRSGEIRTAGQTVVCLPNRVVVKITGAAQLDAVAG